jgi:hypothetical protein
MITVISSIIKSESVQQDGSVLVTEEHTLSNGLIVTVPYQAANPEDIQDILAARAVAIEEDAQRKARIAAEAHNFEMPLHKSEFRDRYLPEEQGAVALFYATYLQNEQLTVEQKAAITAGIDYYKDAGSIYLSHPLTIAAVQMHEQLGLIAAGRAVQILGIE